MLIRDAAPARFAGLTALLLLGAMESGRAQVNVGGFVGFYAPTAEVKVGSAFFTIFDATAKPGTALMYGGQARAWLHRRLGVEVSVAHGKSDVAFSSDTAIAGTITIGTLAALLRFPLGELSNPVWLAGGVAVIKHGGRAWKDFSETSDLGATLGLGTEFRLAGPLRLELGFQGLFYSVALEGTTGRLPSAFQVDMSGRAGLSLRLGGDRELD